ncbi:diguanylate cyclase [Leptothrix cholodnii SP-6]|uniref:diguanylate cyclase n=1 Tax=Leptothrix cholodnii (strain ATCC 51168 / LMG 8142 / SP-6) TaxID=395495 RepID=B1Y3T8_LEPCP|nr:GGDEF domain-containing protein [Leptothrix cholodnii]ACB33332.1 diguanylate cyclase [Leptothrix cholodnii SP-6]
MKHAWRRWLAPPAVEGDEDKRRRAAVVNTVVLGSIAFMLIVLLGMLLGGKAPRSVLWMDVGLLAAYVLMHRLLHRGHVGLAAMGLTLIGFTGLTLINMRLGTIRTPTASIYLFIVLMAGAVFQLRGLLTAAAASSLAVLGLIQAENAGLLPRPDYSVGLMQWVTYTALFGLASFLTYQGNQVVRRALARAEAEIEQRKLVEAELSRIAITDALTGVWNRRHFEQTIGAERAKAQRHHTPLSLLLFDVDHFKALNDQFGHQAGDQVLTELARLVGRSLRDGDVLARWGGEEFAVILHHCPAADALRLAEKLRGLVAGHAFDRVGTVTASFGVAELQPDETLDAWFRRVDLALYAAKSGGRNAVRLGA